MLNPEDLLKNDNKKQYVSYKQTCLARNLIEDTEEYYDAVKEAFEIGCTNWQRLSLVVQIIGLTDVTNIERIWNDFKCNMCVEPKEITITKNKEYPSHHIYFSEDTKHLYTDMEIERIEQYTLFKLKQLLEKCGYDYPVELPEVKYESTDQSNMTKE